MSRGSSIIAQVAAKAAAALFQGTGDAEGAMKAMARFHIGIITLGGPPEEDSPPVVVQGGVQAPVVGGVIPQAQAALAQGGIQAAVARDLSTDEARWQDALINYPNDWYNNVGDAKASSGGGRGPDFRFKNDSADVKPLWLNGNYGPAPAWVFERLGMAFPGAPAAQPVATQPVTFPATPQPGTTGAVPPPQPVVTSYGPGESPF